MLNQWVDIHAHFYPPVSPQQTAKRLQNMKDTCWNVTEAHQWSPESTLAYMDKAGIAMQMLSCIPKDLDLLRVANDYGASLCRQFPSRFGFLAALPTDNVEAAIEEVKRGYGELQADGFAVTCHYNQVYLSDARLDPVWDELNRREAVVFVHPDGFGPPSMGRPHALIEVAGETARTVTDMLYTGTFRRYSKIRFVLAHGGGSLPALSGRLLLLGDKSWIPNPNKVTAAEIELRLKELYLDTAGTCPTALGPALMMTSPEHIVYGSDCGVPCTSDESLSANIAALLAYKGLSNEQIEAIGHNALSLFPAAAARLKQCQAKS